MIAGYPGYPEKKDKEKRGQAVLGTGKILKIEETETGGYIVHYNMNTRSGMSGSPIFANDPNFYQIVDQALGKGNYLLTERESVHITDPKRALFGFGVHTGGAPGGKANIGTLLTPEIEAWELAQLNSYGLAGHYCTSIEANEQEPWIAPLQALIVKSPPKQPPAQDQMVVNSLMTISGKSRESCISALEAAQNQPNLAIQILLTGGIPKKDEVVDKEQDPKQEDAPLKVAPQKASDVEQVNDAGKVVPQKASDEEQLSDTEKAAYAEFKASKYTKDSVHTEYSEEAAEARVKQGDFDYGETMDFA